MFEHDEAAKMVAKRASPKKITPPRKTGKRFIDINKMLAHMKKNAGTSKATPLPKELSKKPKIDDSVGKVIFESPLVKITREELKITKEEEGKPCKVSFR